MNPTNPTLVSSSRNSQARFRLLPFTAGRVGKLAACLILLASSAQAQKFTWSAPVPFGSLNADQILTNFPGTRIAAAMSAGGPTSVTLSTGLSIVFAARGVWADLAGGNGTFSGAFSLDTSNANFNTCLNSGYYDGATHTITMNNLVVGKQYSVQLFALDDRSLTPAGSARTINWQDPNDATDISATYTMADNAYIVGTFTAANTSEAIQENMLNANNGNFNCLVLRAVGWTPPPSFAVQPLNSSGFLGESAKLTGSASGDPAPTYQWESGPAGGSYTNLVEGAKYSGTTNTTLIINNLTTADAVPVYVLVASNAGGSVTSREASIIVQVRALVGKWFTNNTLADVSGYQPAGTHDGYDTAGTGSYVFTNDVPPGKIGQSLLLFNGDTGIAISNSSTLDATYTNTFDERIDNTMTVACWGKGFPANWNPFVSKWGEGPPYNSPNGGWQLRASGDAVHSCFTVRDNNAGGFVFGNTGNALDDMATTTVPSNDGGWHYYVGTFDTATGIRDLYVDGLLAAQETNNVAYDIAQYSHLCIGAKDSAPGNSFGAYFTGQIYDVRIYNYAITSSQVLDLYGIIAPGIASQPHDTAVFTGSKATLSATASGTPPLTYQWQLNGTNVNLLPDNANFIGANSNVLTVLSMTTNDVGSYHVIVTSTLGLGTVTSRNALLTIAPKVMVGRWLASGTLNDISGYRPAGTHDGVPVGGGNYYFTNDLPVGMSGQSVSFPLSDSGIEIQNSATTDAAYTNTFDDVIHTAMTVTFWARGSGGSWSWNPWVSKQGDNGPGWQFREGGGPGVIPCWTIRGGSGTYTLGGGPSWSRGGDQEDLHAVYNPPGHVGAAVADGDYYQIDSQWHFYSGTFSADTGLRNLYIDGVLSGQETGCTAYNMAPNSHLCIDAKDVAGTLGNYSAFTIYDVRIFNYDLSQSQVVNMMPDPVITVQPPLALNAYVGNVTRISATVMTHSTPVTNQWQLNGTNLVDGTLGGSIISGSTSSALTIGNATTNVQGVYRLIVSDSHGTVISGNTTVTVLSTVAPPAGNLVGAWLTGAANLADASGFRPAGTHDGYGVTGTGTPSSNYGFTNDVPGGWTGTSLVLSGTATIAISNSSTLDASYVNTFDDTATNMTVSFWAKGWPGGWNPFVSKYGESGQGWQLRRNGGSNPCWTVRGTGATEDMSASGLTMSDDGLWHHYAGTFTFDGTNGIRNLYVDGVQVASETEIAPYALAASSYLCIGGRDGGGNAFGNYFTGKIYDTRIYKVALTEAQVNSLAWQLATPTTPVLLPGGLYGNKFVLTWSSGTLLSATNVTGPYLPVAGATSPYTNDVTTAPQMFFRLSNP
jgi:Concanavalin A-like lectin/glucanases superfamily/Immunoglobulin domain